MAWDIGTKIAALNLAATVVLAITTFFYLLATYKIASAAAKQTDASVNQTAISRRQDQILYRPYLAIIPAANLVAQESAPGSGKLAAKTDWFDLRLPLENVGSVIVKYAVEEFSFDGKGDYPQTVGVLMPKQQQFARQKFSVPATDIRQGLTGTGTMRVRYWNPADPATVHKSSIRFSIGADAFFRLDEQDAD